ncbi:MAG: hypothetical protein WAQ52_08660 [Terriglobales bacterium]
MKREPPNYDQVLISWETRENERDITALRTIVAEHGPLKDRIVWLEARHAAVAKLLAELPELLGDYKHLAPDADGKTDPVRLRRISRVAKLLAKAGLDLDKPDPNFKIRD